jgi:hypothetical protein
MRHLSKLINEIKHSYALRQGIADAMGQLWRWSTPQDCFDDSDHLLPMRKFA